MFSRFTEKAIQAIMLAQEEAKNFNHNYVILVNGNLYSSNFDYEDKSKIKITYYDKRFEVRTDIGATSKLVPNSKFVIAISCTMAVSYCVLNYKKILLIFNDQIRSKNPSMMSNLIYMSKVLKVNLFNINNDFKKEKLLFSLNKKTYDKYKFNYLTSKKVKDEMNVDIFNKLFTN